MIINGIKLAAAKKKIAKLVAEREQGAYILPIKSIGVITDYKNRKSFEILAGLKKQFKIKDKNFKTLLFAPKNQDIKDYNGQSYSLKDIDIKAEIMGEELKQFTSEGIDLLITFAEENNSAVHLITAHCKAGIKVGRYPVNQALYDIILQAEDDAELFTEELMKYLKSLKKFQDE